MPRGSILLLLALGACTTDDPDRIDTNPETAVEVLTCGELAAREAADVQRFLDYYSGDPVGYLARVGLPANARRARMIERLGGDPAEVWATLVPAWDGAGVYAAAVDGGLSADLGAAYFEVLEREADPESDTFLGQLVDLVVARGDELAEEAGVPPLHYPDNPTPALLEELIDVGLLELPTLLAPGGPKDCIDLEQAIPDAERHEELCEAPEGGGGEADSVRWEDIENSETLWPEADGDPMCAGVAVGACLAKLGEGPATVDCEGWEDLGDDLGTDGTPDGEGAYPDDIWDRFEELGYEHWTAWSGPFESAAEEAEAALARGCDVFLMWPDHLEMVTSIDVDEEDDEQATVGTLSWGDAATCTFDGGETSGASNMSKTKNGKEATFEIVCTC